MPNEFANSWDLGPLSFWVRLSLGHLIHRPYHVLILDWTWGMKLLEPTLASWVCPGKLHYVKGLTCICTLWAKLRCTRKCLYWYTMMLDYLDVVYISVVFFQWMSVLTSHFETDVGFALEKHNTIIPLISKCIAYIQLHLICNVIIKSKTF